MKECVLQFLETSFGPLENGLRKYLLESLRTTEVDAYTILLREGDTATTIGFIEKGLIRSSRTDENGNEFTSFFVEKEDVFISIRSFFTQSPSRETLETLEPCIIHSITFTQLKKALTQWPSFNFHRAELLQKYYLLSEEREDMRHMGSAERFAYLCEHYRTLFDRVADKYLASFLSMTPSYFSKLKSEYIAKNGKF